LEQHRRGTAGALNIPKGLILEDSV
jgi:hypothetical protein